MTVVPLERPRESYMAYVRPGGDFPDGWAMLPSNQRKPHWTRFKAKDGFVIAKTLCGRWYMASPTAQIAEPGNFPRCKRCIAVLWRQAGPAGNA